MTLQPFNLAFDPAAGGAATASAVAQPELPVSSAALDSLAARVRPAGLFLLAMTLDGRLAYHDPEPELFFARYALPLLQRQQATESPVLRAVRSLTVAAAQGLPGDALPGLTVVTVPYTEKRQVTAVLVLAARSDTFGLTEDVLRCCTQLGLDAGWLASAASPLPAYGTEALLRPARMLQAMARDTVKLSGLEQELDSLSGQLANTYEELSLIYQISSGMKVNRGAADFFRQACQDVLEVLNVRGMGVVLGEGIINRPEPAVYGSMQVPSTIVERLHDQLMSTMRQRKTSLIVHDLSDPEAGFEFLATYARQMIAVPLQRQDEVLGVLFALDKSDGEFDSVDSKLLNSIANESAIYLENARLFEDVHGLMMGLLHSLTSAVDAKDAYTCGHSERVALVSRHLAAQVGLNDRNVEQVYMAGLLHDVGKIGVPEAVLQKCGRLTAEEFEQIKRHPAIGAKILQDVKQIREIIPGVLHHHERFDGKGYPAGLSGSNIPLMGRIICLADCFDAMTSSRTYRKALPLEVALTEIRRCSGTQFDPALAEVFLRTTPDGFRELLSDHHAKAKKFRELQETLRS